MRRVRHKLIRESSMPSIVAGNRGGKILVHDGFRYQKNRERNNAIYWRCWRSDCRTPMKTNVFDVEDETAVIQVLQVSPKIDY